jgi:hypothetical protein
VRSNHLAAKKAARRGGVTKLLRSPGSRKDENALTFHRRDRESSLLNELERAVRVSADGLDRDQLPRNDRRGFGLDRLLELPRFVLEHACGRLTGSAGDAAKLSRHTGCVRFE